MPCQCLNGCRQIPVGCRVPGAGAVLRARAAGCMQGGHLVVCYLRDVVSQLELQDLQSGALGKELPMPGLGSVASFSGRRQDSQLFFNFTGFTEPGAIYQCDPPPPPCRGKPCVVQRSVLDTSFQSPSCLRAFVRGTESPAVVVRRNSHTYGFPCTVMMNCPVRV